MPAPPPTPTTANIFDYATPIGVFLGDTSGNPPTVSDQVDHLEPITIRRSTGGGQLDTLTFNYNLAKTGNRLENTGVPINFNHQVEVRGIDQTGNPFLLAWGQLSSPSQQISRDTERLTITAAVQNQHFGAPLTQVPVWDPVGGDKQFVDGGVTINPEIDGEIRGNRGKRDATPSGQYVFLDYDATRTTSSQNLQGVTDTGGATVPAQKWTLADAIETFCWLLNPSETNIKNPDWAVLDGILNPTPVDRDEILQNVDIPLGAYLPEILDRLLDPNGFSWYLDNQLDPSTGDRESTITVFKKNSGATMQVYAVAPANPAPSITFANTNITDAAVDFNLFDMANRVEVKGSPVRREVSIELQPGWPQGDDELTITQLEQNANNPTDKRNTGRLFVANEAGDYTDDRTTITDVLSLQSELEDPDDTDRKVIPRRRRFLPCISLEDDGEPNGDRGIYVEWRDYAETATPDWQRIPEEMSFEVLDHEMGIRFTGTRVPQQIWESFRNIRNDSPSKPVIRVTASVESDFCIWGKALRDSASPNGLDVTLVIDRSDAFHFREIKAGSLFDPLSFPTPPPSDEVDDRTRLTSYAEQIRNADDVAEISTSLTLDRVDHTGYGLSALITKIAGREISLSSTAVGVSPSDEVYPQIVGLTYRLQDEQRTELTLESFRPKAQVS